MAIAVGKRKRDEEDDNEDGVDLKARFQAAFEARFKPLAKTSSPALPKVERIDQAASVIEEEDEDEDESEDSEWDGLSDEGDALVIVDHGSAKITDDEALRRQEMKVFMASCFGDNIAGLHANVVTEFQTTHTSSESSSRGQSEDGRCR